MVVNVVVPCWCNLISTGNIILGPKEVHNFGNLPYAVTESCHNCQDPEVGHPALGRGYAIALTSI